MAGHCWSAGDEKVAIVGMLFQRETAPGRRASVVCRSRRQRHLSLLSSNFPNSATFAFAIGAPVTAFAKKTNACS